MRLCDRVAVVKPHSNHGVSSQYLELDNATPPGLIVYQAKADLQTMTKFYQDRMAKDGWTQVQDPVITPHWWSWSTRRINGRRRSI